MVVQTIKRSCTDFMFTDYVSCSSVCYISHSMSIFIFFSARAFKTICLKHGSNKIIGSKRSCANRCERCLYKAYRIECGFLMADFDETSCSCENDKEEISAYERIKVIFFMTETLKINFYYGWI